MKNLTNIRYAYLLFIMLLSVFSFSENYNEEISDYRISVKMKINRILARINSGISEDQFVYYFQVIDDESKVIEIVTPDYYKFFAEPPKKFKYKIEELLITEFSDYQAERDSLYYKVMNMDKKSIKQNYCYDWGGVNYKDNPNILDSNSFTLALIRRGFYVFIGDESGGLVLD